MNTVLSAKSRIEAVLIQGTKFRHWFAGSVVTNDLGEPLLTYRGEHGPVPEKLIGCAIAPTQTRLGSISFGSARAASIYAINPNSADDFPYASRVTAAYLSIKNPFLNRPGDPFVELEEIAQALGAEEAEKVAFQFSKHIMHTNKWCDEIGNSFENYRQYTESQFFNIKEIFFNAYVLFDDHRCVDLLKVAGYDGAIFGGCGETLSETEYRVFQNEQIWNKFFVS